MPNNMKIDYVELPAENFDVVEAFYRQVFSWTFEDYGPEYRAFSDGQVDGGFYRSNLKSRTGNGAALIIFYAEDLVNILQVLGKFNGQACCCEAEKCFGQFKDTVEYYPVAWQKWIYLDFSESGSGVDAVVHAVLAVNNGSCYTCATRFLNFQKGIVLGNPCPVGW